MAFPRIKRVSRTQSEDALCLTLKGAIVAKKEKWQFEEDGLLQPFCAPKDEPWVFVLETASNHG